MAGPAARVRSRSRVLVWLTALLLCLGWCVALTEPARADGPTTFANTTSIPIPATGSPDQIGPASPYPSSITVSGLTGAVTKVTVTFAGLTHSVLNDIDAMVVAPDGSTNLVVLSDLGGSGSLRTASDATLTFDDAGANFPNQVSIPSGTYKPTNEGSGDTFPTPAPTPSNQTTLAGAFTGIDPNGSWSLYVTDDSAGDVGVMAGGWSLTVTTATAAKTTSTTVASSDTTSTTGDPVTFTASVLAGGSAVTTGTVQFSVDGSNLGAPVPLNGSGRATLTTSSLTEGTHLVRASYNGASGFLTSNGTVSQRVDNATVVTDRTYCNPGPITVPADGAARPYPSNVFVSGLGGTVTKVTAQLRGMSHTAPIDLDVMLSGPGAAKNVMLLSDTGGQGAVSDIDLTFDDDAAGGVPSPLATGTYRPTDVDPDGQVDAFPAPAPTPDNSTALSSFDGASANGTWSLWVVDDATGDSGRIANGWCVTVTSQSVTTTTLTTSPNPSRYGQVVGFTARVASGGSPVTGGTVQFTDGGVAYGPPVPVAADGTAQLSTVALAVGTHRIGASYSGTDDLAASADSADQVVQRATSQTTLTSDLNPSTVGDTVTFTAKVVSPTAFVDQGSMVFSVDGVDQPPIAVPAGGRTTFSTADLPSGSHRIGARYVGTASIGDSEDALTQVVSRIGSTTTLVSDANPSVFGGPVTFTATVTAGGAPVTSGSVEFSDDGTTLGAVSLGADGTVTLTTSTLSVGSHTIEAAYAGTGSFAGSQDQLTQVVGQQTSVTSVVSDLNPSTFGASVTVTATVTAGGDPVSGGSIQFSEGGDPLGAPVPVAAGGTAALTTATLTTGTHTITATYSGTTDIAGSSGSVDQVVGPAPTTTTLTSSANPQSYADVVFLQASVTAGGSRIVAGTVTFTEGSTVLCTAVVLAPFGYADCGVNRLGVGTHELTATFSGTDDYASSSTTIDQVITIQRGATTSLESSRIPSTLGSEVTFTATVADGGDPIVEGTVEFRVDGTVVALAQPIDQEGTATFETDALTAGSHTITATYSGTANVDAGEPGQLIQEVRLVADAGGPYDIAEGQGVTLDASKSSPGVTYEWDLNDDGVFGDASGPSPLLSWKDLESFGIDDGQATPTTYPIAVRVTAGTAPAVIADGSIVVGNTAPTATVTGALRATVGRPFTVKVGADDPSAADLAALFGYTVDWGDGSPVQTLTGPADPPVTHTYTRAGIVTAVFTATDKDGGTGEPTAVSVTVTPASSPPPAPPTSDRPTAPPTDGPTTGPTSSPSHLADTGAGAGSGWLLVVGAALVAGGALLVLAGRRRVGHHLHRL